MNGPMLVCAAGCGIGLHPAAAAGGFDRHPGCESGFDPNSPVTDWRCGRAACTAGGPVASTAEARERIDAHEKIAHAPMKVRRTIKAARIPQHQTPSQQDTLKVTLW